MLTRRSARIIIAPIAMAAALAGATGCGGLAPGDHVVYRVATSQGAPEKTCYANNMIPDSIKDDSSTFLGTGTLLLYINADKTAELDTGSVVIPGAKADKGYKFSGEAVDVEYPLGGTATKFTKTTQISVSLTIDGSTVSGTTTTVTDVKCEGPMCPTDPTPECTGTTTFKGVQIDDADITIGGSQSTGNP